MERRVAVTGLTDITVIERTIEGTIEAIFASVTVGSLCVVLTVNTDTSSITNSIHVQGKFLSVNVRIIVTVLRVIEAVTLLTDVRIVNCCRFPCLLRVSMSTDVTLRSICVVLTLAFENRVLRVVCDVTGVCMSVTDTSTSDIDVFDGVEVSSSDCRILFSNGYQVSKSCLWSQESQSNVGCLRKLL